MAESLPCGICRQFMYEFSPDIFIITGTDRERLNVRKLSDRPAAGVCAGTRQEGDNRVPRGGAGEWRISHEDWFRQPSVGRPNVGQIDAAERDPGGKDRDNDRQASDYEECDPGHLYPLCRR